MSKTVMLDYFRTIKKREVQLSSKNSAPISFQAAASKKLHGVTAGSPTTANKESLNSNDISVHLCKQSPRSDRVISASKKRKLSSDEDKVPAKINKLGEKSLKFEENVAEVISSKDVERLRKKPQNAEKIAQIRESLQKINKLSDKIKQIRKPESELSISSVTAKSSDREAAFQRHHSLASEEAVKLGLPSKYKMLAEMFKCLDSVVSVMHNRQEICDFSKLKPALQQMLRRTFTLNHLGQIAAIFPNGFIFKQEKVYSYGEQGKVLGYQLTIYPNFDCFNNSGESATLNITKKNTTTKDAKQQVFRSMTPNFLVSRQKFVYDSLLSVVKKHHEEFMSNLIPPMKLSSEKLIRWHPQFKLDEVQDITSAPLPEPANTETYCTAKDVLAKIRGMYNSRIDNALEFVANKSEESILSESTIPINVTAPAAVKGIPLALLEKIRAKEAAQIKANLTRNPTNELRLATIAQLPEVSRILKSLFIAEKRVAIPYSLAVTKVMESAAGSVSLGEMERNIALLAELLPEWLSVIDIRSGKFLKINKQINLNDVITKLETEEKRCRQIC